MIIKDYQSAKSKMFENKESAIPPIYEDDFFDRERFLLLSVEKVSDYFNFILRIKEEDISDVTEAIIKISANETPTINQIQQITSQVRKNNSNELAIILGVYTSIEFSEAEILVALGKSK